MTDFELLRTLFLLVCVVDQGRSSQTPQLLHRIMVERRSWWKYYISIKTHVKEQNIHIKCEGILENTMVCHLSIENIVGCIFTSFIHSQSLDSLESWSLGP